jgi:hypothetical protein
MRRTDAGAVLGFTATLPHAKSSAVATACLVKTAHLLDFAAALVAIGSERAVLIPDFVIAKWG